MKNNDDEKAMAIVKAVELISRKSSDHTTQGRMISMLIGQNVGSADNRVSDSEYVAVASIAELLGIDFDGEKYKIFDNE